MLYLKLLGCTWHEFKTSNQVSGYACLQLLRQCPLLNRFQLEMGLTEKSAEAEAHTREIAENRRRLEELIQENKRTKGESEKKISWAGSSFKTKFWVTKSLVCHSTVV